MKASDAFTNTISAHLERVALADPLFAETLKKPAKNIKDCITYILNQVKNSGNNGFADEEIYGMAIHYYDEDTLDVGKPIQAKVVVNHTADAFKAAVANRVYENIPAKKNADKKQEISNQPSLFS